MKNVKNGWRDVELSEVCTFKYGKSLPEASRTDGDVPVYGSNGVVGMHHSAITSGPAIIIGRKGSLGEVNFSAVPCWPIDTTYYIDSSCTNEELRWLAYRVAALELTRLNRAAAVPGLNRDDAYRQRLLLPPLPEQRRIAEILNRAEVLRAKRRAALTQLDVLTRSVFLEMFGNPATNPKRWPLRPLSSLVRNDDKINYGVVQPGNDVADGVPFVRVGDLSDGRVSHVELKRISPAIEAKYKRSRLRGDEILVSCVGSIGVVALADDSVAGFNIARAIARIPLADIRNRAFVAAYLNSDFVQQYFTNELRTVSQPTLNIKQLSHTAVIFPPEDLRYEFARRAEAVDRLKAMQRTSLGELDALFASLQHRAFRGEL